MRRCTSLLAALAVVVALVAAPAAADVLYSQLPVADNGALRSDFNHWNPQQEADDFELPSPSYIHDVHWWGIYYNQDEPEADDFTIRFFNPNASGLPEVSPFVSVAPVGLTRTLTAMTALGDPVYFYEADLPSDVLASAGAAYFLSIVNATQSGEWSWVADGDGTHYYRTGEGQAWSTSSIDTDHAFELTGTIIPEPATIALVGLGILGLARRRRK